MMAEIRRGEKHHVCPVRLSRVHAAITTEKLFNITFN